MNKKYKMKFLSLEEDRFIFSNKKAQIGKFPALLESIGLIALFVILFLLFIDIFNAPQINTIKSTNQYISKADDIIVFLKSPAGDKTVADLIAQNDFQRFKTHLKNDLNTDKCLLMINDKIVNAGCNVVKKPNARINTQLPLYNGSIIDVYLELEW